MKKTIITVTGYDQSGIISAVSTLLSKQECNIENISQTTLQSQFAGIFIVLVPQELEANDLEALLCNKLSAMELSIQVRLLEHSQPSADTVNSDCFVLTTTGPDKQGLVAKISSKIADFGINIVNLKAVFRGGETPDNNIMIYEIDIPQTVNHATFSKTLRETAEEMGLEITLQHKNIFNMVNKI